MLEVALGITPFIQLVHGMGLCQRPAPLSSEYTESIKGKSHCEMLKKKNSGSAASPVVCGEKGRSDGQEALKGGNPLKKCAAEHRELPGYARPHLYDGYEVFVTFLLKHHSR